MITYDVDRVTLIGVDDAGRPLAVRPTDVLAYTAMLKVLDRQNQARLQNEIAKGAYLTALNQYQFKVNNRMLKPDEVAPTKPEMLLVSDSGTETHKPFDPALPDPEPAPPLSPVSPGGALHPITGPSDSDKLDVILSLVTKIASKIA